MTGCAGSRDRGVVGELDNDPRTGWGGACLGGVVRKGGVVSVHVISCESDSDKTLSSSSSPSPSSSSSSSSSSPALSTTSSHAI